MSQAPQMGLETPSGRLETVLRIVRAVPACRTPQELFRMIADELRRTLSFDQLHAIIYKEHTAEVQWHSFGPDEIPYPDHIPVEETQSWWVHTHQQSLVIADWNEETRFPQLREFIRKFSMRLTCSVPLATTHRQLRTFSWTRRPAFG